ncbi:MAG: GNAT family protein [Planctomycetota bacterium]
MSFTLKVDDELSLRLIEPHHAEEMFAVADANREHIARWMPWLTPGYNIGDARAYCERSLREFAERKQLAVSMLVDGKIVGGSGWTDWTQKLLFDDTLDASYADIGYWIAQTHVGRGLVTRAAKALTALAIRKYGIRRLTIRAEPKNERSWKIPERLGYTYEGTVRDTFRVDGRRIDHKVYSMLAEEWTP